MSCAGSNIPAALFSTLAGKLVWVGDQESTFNAAEPIQKVCISGMSPIRSFDIETSFGGSLVMCGLDNEILVCLSRNDSRKWENI